MTRIIVAALALVALAAVAFVAEVRRIAAGLDVTPAADDSEVVGMPPAIHVHVNPAATDWNAWFDLHGRMN